MAVAATIRVLLIFALILVAIKRLSLGSSFALGALILGLIFGMAPASVLLSMAKALVEPKTLSLSVVVSLILVLSHSMEATGQMERMLQGFKGLVASPFLNLALFPALIGLLPMPGGAVFSAPMVKNIGDNRNLNQNQLSFLNYWFRHIWEYWWPLYPGVLLATSLAAMNLWSYVWLMLPFTPVAVAAGRLFIGRTAVAAAPKTTRASLAPFVKELAPIALVIGGGLAAGHLLSAMTTTIAKELGLIVALVPAIGLAWHTGKLSRSQRLKIIFNKKLLGMYFMVSAVLIFKAILQDSTAVSQISAELIRWHIPLVPICIILPMLVGIVSGITIAFVGTTFPVIFALLGASGQQEHIKAFMMLAMTSGFAGVLVSPLHLCLILSNAFFKASHTAVYRLIVPAAAILLAGALVYFAILYYIGA